ncbi:peptide chain release factor N(5)-glutamine methyltransferase [Fluviicola sp.]|uniref:peptide chain release factor N(5)-glutamine methyltransferase n=1 Tax=Fluviicola sp. TaxID=1917219 RepID=UPI0031DCDE08
MDQKRVLENWKKQLGELFPEREIRNLFHLTLEDALGFNRALILSNQVGEFSGDQMRQLEQVLNRLKAGEPLQYIVGFTYFDDLKIQVAPGVLIPRPETEELVAWIDESLQNRENLKMEDWCTGSGCIALALQNRYINSEVFGYDISDEALEIARNNGKSLHLAVHFENKDALNAVSSEKADVIVSNPPYIPWQEKAEMHRNVTEFEPDLALFVPNDDPLLFYRSLTIYASKSLAPGGLLFFELHENYARETKQMVEESGFTSVEIREDLQGKQRMLKAVWNA